MIKGLANLQSQFLNAPKLRNQRLLKQETPRKRTKPKFYYYSKKNDRWECSFENDIRLKCKSAKFHFQENLSQNPVHPQHQQARKTGRKFTNLHSEAARRAWNLARRAWASFCKGFQRRRDVPVGGRDVPVGGRPTARQVHPTPFSCATGFLQRLPRPFSKLSRVSCILSSEHPSISRYFYELPSCARCW